MNEIVLAFATAVCVGYMAYSMSYGIPESLSATYYKIKYPWLLQAVMFIVGIGLWIVWFGVSETNHLWMVFLSCSSLLFVGAAPAFRLELEGKVHYTAAIICGVCSLCWQIAEHLWDVTLWWFFLCGMLCLTWRKEYMWWLEMGLVGSLLSNLWRIV